MGVGEQLVLLQILDMHVGMDMGEGIVLPPILGKGSRVAWVWIWVKTSRSCCSFCIERTCTSPLHPSSPLNGPNIHTHTRTHTDTTHTNIHTNTQTHTQTYTHHTTPAGSQSCAGSRQCETPRCPHFGPHAF